MTQNRVHRLSVINDKSQVVDILTQSDIIAFIARHSYDEWFSERADKTLEGNAHISDPGSAQIRR